MLQLAGTPVATNCSSVQVTETSPYASPYAQLSSELLPKPGGSRGRPARPLDHDVLARRRQCRTRDVGDADRPRARVLMFERPRASTRSPSTLTCARRQARVAVVPEAAVSRAH